MNKGAGVNGGPRIVGRGQKEGLGESPLTTPTEMTHPGSPATPRRLFSLRSKKEPESE